jgi:hypothetical protein
MSVTGGTLGSFPDSELLYGSTAAGAKRRKTNGGSALRHVARNAENAIIGTLRRRELSRQLERDAGVDSLSRGN